MKQKYLLASCISLVLCVIFIYGCCLPVYKPNVSRALAELVNVVIDDSQGGNNDGKLDPGETVRLFLTLKNSDEKKVSMSKAMLFTTQPGIQITQNMTSFKAMYPGQQTSATSGFLVSVDPTVSVSTVSFYLQTLCGTNYGVIVPVDIPGAASTTVG